MSRLIWDPFRETRVSEDEPPVRPESDPPAEWAQEAAHAVMNRILRSRRRPSESEEADRG